jgi:hypothetical protein
MNSPYKQIRNLLVILFAGISCAAIFAIFMIYFYGPSGRYQLQNVLLDPTVLSQISSKRYKVDRISYSYWSPPEKKWNSVSINTQNYQTFFDSIKNDRSLEQVPQEIVSLFGGTTSTDLTIYVIVEEGKSAKGTATAFQKVQFSNKGFYRVELRGQTSNEMWAYFSHPDIDKMASELFLRKTNI